MDAVEDIKSRLSIEDVVSDYLELKRAGRNLRALSPFSNEKTPSFMVSPEKQIWHDFSSGKGGNVFSFVMEMEGVDFKGALEILARKSGVDLSQYQRGDGARGKQKVRLYDCLEAAAHFYQLQFSKNKTALEYILKKRAFSKATALAFRIGYSPNNGNALCHYLQTKKFTNEEIKQAGLSAQRQKDVYDMFRGRIMVPLMDSTGRVVGFTARLLHDDPKAPKYINTPQTMLYDKGRQVYGLHLAKDAIRKTKFVVVVEGNLDVIASHQVGVTNVVASAGTAMTEMHLKELGRFTDDIRLAFDQDSAGLQAMERVIPLASKVGVSLSIITVPEGKDPDELIQKNPEAWQRAIDSYDYAIDWLMSQYEKKLDIGSGSGKKAFTDTLLPVVAQLRDTVEQDHYIIQLAEKIGVSREALRTKLSKNTKTTQTVRKKSAEPGKVSPEQADATKTQNQFLALCLALPDLRGLVTPIRTEMLPDDQAQAMLRLLEQYPDTTPKDIIKKIQEGANSGKEVASSVGDQADVMRKVEDYATILVLLYEELYANLEFIELQYEAARLQVRVIEKYVKIQKARLADAMRGADDTQTETLLQEVKKLDVLLKTAKETLSGER